MTWSRATAIAGSAVVTLASCPIRIVRGRREPRRDWMALGAGCGTRVRKRRHRSELAGKGLALLLQILSGAGFPNQFFCDSWVVGFWRGRPWLAGRRIGKKSLDAFSSRFWIGWVTRRGDKCVHATCRG